LCATAIPFTTLLRSRGARRPCCRNGRWREPEHHGSRDLVMPCLGVLVEDGPEVSETEEKTADEPPDDLAHEHLAEPGDSSCLVVDRKSTRLNSCHVS